MTRLPIPGSDDGQWGNLLNDFLAVEHENDGSLKATGSLASKADAADVAQKYTKPVSGIPKSDLSSSVQATLDAADAFGPPVDADATTKGVLQLTGDLAGTATNPQIAAGVIVNTDISAGAAIDQTKIANLVTDLSNKADATATANALAGKADTTSLANGLATKANDTGVVHTSGNETVAGIKTFTSAPAVPDASFSIDKTIGLQTALDSKASGSHTHAQSDITNLTTDLGTKADATAVANALAGKEPTLTAGTVGQYYRGDKTWATLDKAAAGLGNVDNTSDASKNAAPVTLTNKTIDTPVLSGTVSGTYTLGGTPTFPATVVSTTGTQTLTNKTVTAPVLSGTVTGTYTIGGTPTFPSTVVSTTGTQTLTNKTIDAASNTVSNVNATKINSKNITVSQTQPSSPAVGDVWINY